VVDPVVKSYSPLACEERPTVRYTPASARHTRVRQGGFLLAGFGARFIAIAHHETLLPLQAVTDRLQLRQPRTLPDRVGRAGSASLAGSAPWHTANARRGWPSRATTAAHTERQSQRYDPNSSGRHALSA
jgi:hypothetical protein